MTARVGHVELHVGGLDGEAAAVGHRVARVHHQVHDHLLDLTRIGLHPPESHRGDHRQVHVLADQPSEHRLHPGHHRVEVQHLRLEHLLAAEREQLLGERGGAVGGGAHQGGVAVDRLLGAESRDDELRATGDHGEQIVEVVSDPPSELPDRIHLLRLAELLLEATTLADVLQHPEGAHLRTGRVA